MDMNQTRYTPSQVAEILGVKVGTVYALLSRGELQGYHLGRRRVITGTQLEFYRVNKRRVEVDMTYALGPAQRAI